MEKVVEKAKKKYYILKMEITLLVHDRVLLDSGVGIQKYDVEKDTISFI